MSAHITQATADAADHLATIAVWYYGVQILTLEIQDNGTDITSPKPALQIEWAARTRCPSPRPPRWTAP